MNRRLAVWFVVLALFGIVALAAADGPPTLTEVEALETRFAVSEYKRTQAELKLAQRSAQDATAAILKVVAARTRDGYTFDLETLTYTPVPKAP